MITHLGGFGKTVFFLKEAVGIEGDCLILRQRDGKVEIGQAEIVAIASFAVTVDLEPSLCTSQRFRERMELAT